MHGGRRVVRSSAPSSNSLTRASALTVHSYALQPCLLQILSMQAHGRSPKTFAGADPWARCNASRLLKLQQIKACCGIADLTQLSRFDILERFATSLRCNGRAPIPSNQTHHIWIVDPESRRTPCYGDAAIRLDRGCQPNTDSA